MHVEPPTDRDHALTVRAGCSDSVHLALREGCSSSSPRVRDDSRLIVSGTVRLIAEHELRLILRGTQPLEPLPGVRFESTRVHNFGRTRTADIGRCGFWREGGERIGDSYRRLFFFASVDGGSRWRAAQAGAASPLIHGRELCHPSSTAVVADHRARVMVAVPISGSALSLG